jgi:hypothetical protein
MTPDIANSTKFFNPYPALGAPDSNCWPRGFPLSLINRDSTFNASLKEVPVKAGDIGVLQSLADHHPDVDAVFRMVKKKPGFRDKNNPTLAPTPV